MKKLILMLALLITGCGFTVEKEKTTIDPLNGVWKTEQTDCPTYLKLNNGKYFIGEGCVQSDSSIGVEAVFGSYVTLNETLFFIPEEISCLEQDDRNDPLTYSLKNNILTISNGNDVFEFNRTKEKSFVFGCLQDGFVPQELIPIPQ